ncbi:GNAT family acetyltransferase [Roseovarius sp. SCSIO 43702]|nr:GNAT family acetyltransferase [Roseovarius sp. SCSIO 43702]
MEEADIDALIALWDACDMTRPWNPPEVDIAQFRASPHAAIFVHRHEGRLVAAFAVGEDGHRGWVYYLCTDPAHRRHGLARAAMAQAEDWARARGIAKLHLMVRLSNAPVLAFYEGLGYEDSGVVVMQKWLDPERARLQAEHADAL